MGKERLRKYRQWKKDREAARVLRRVGPRMVSISDPPVPPADSAPADMLRNLRLVGIRMRSLKQEGD